MGAGASVEAVKESEEAKAALARIEALEAQVAALQQQLAGKAGAERGGGDNSQGDAAVGGGGGVPPASREDEARAAALLARLANLHDYHVDEVLELFAEAANEEGLIDRATFTEAFSALKGKNPSSEGKATGGVSPEEALDHLFTAFDTDGTGFVDFAALSSGLSVLCSGSADAKVEAAFHVMDANHDNFLSPDEVSAYLTAVYRVTYATRPEVRASTGLTPEQLAKETAAQVFIDADLNHDGLLSFEEFRSWYSLPNAQGVAAATGENGHANGGAPASTAAASKGKDGASAGPSSGEGEGPAAEAAVEGSPTPAAKAEPSAEDPSAAANAGPGETHSG